MPQANPSISPQAGPLHERLQQVFDTMRADDIWGTPTPEPAVAGAWGRATADAYTEGQPDVRPASRYRHMLFTSTEAEGAGRADARAGRPRRFYSAWIRVPNADARPCRNRLVRLRESYRWGYDEWMLNRR